MRYPWIHQQTHLIQHVSGLSIRLKSGTWVIPMDIELQVPKHLGAVESAGLIREGLNWAGRTLRENVDAPETEVSA